ncbi:hypothetical protein J7L05_02175 [bacterium]|nr:hypothetical protein [bacterium]
MLDVKKVKLDSRNRIFVISPLAKYLAAIKDNGSDSDVEYGITFPLEKDIPALIILNMDKVKDLLDQVEKTDVNDVLGSLLSLAGDEDEKPKGNLRTSVVKTNKIQLYKSEVNRLQLPEGDNKIILDFKNKQVVVWAECEFKKRYPKRYDRFSVDDENE